MIWLWPFVWLGIIVAAVAGAVQLLLTILAIIFSVKADYDRSHDAPSDTKWRWRWLVEHFSEEGANLWLVNREAVVAFNKVYDRGWQAKLARMVEQYPWLMGDRGDPPTLTYDGRPYYGTVYRGPGGRTVGLVLGRFGGQLNLKHPWGYDLRPYPEAHAPQDIHEADQDLVPPWVPYHGEPTGEDWMAAGFYDKGIETMILDYARNINDTPSPGTISSAELKRVLAAGKALREQRNADRVAEEIRLEGWVEKDGSWVRTGPGVDLRNDPRYNREAAVPWRA